MSEAGVSKADREESLIQALHFTVTGIGLGVLAYLLDEYALVWTPLDERAVTAAIIALHLGGLGYWFSTTQATRLSSVIYALGLGGGLGLLYLSAEWSFGWQYSSDTPAVAWGYAATAVTIISLPFFRTVFERGESPWHYPSLFEFAWNAPVTYVIALFFLGIFWIVLFLWGGLFDLIDIDFFQELFAKAWFAWPASLGAFATAVGVLRTREGVILTARGILFALLHWIAPILASATALFVLALPVTGLQPLFDRVDPVWLMVTVTLGALTLVNAVLGDGERDGLTGAGSRFVRLMARVQSVLLPVFVGVAAYTVATRIADRGLTVEDFYFSVVLGILVLHAGAYAVAGVLPAWQTIIQRANVIMAGVTVLVAVLVLTPLVNPFRISAEQYYDRLESGEIAAANFPYGYMRFELGAPGQVVLDRIAANEDLADREVIEGQLQALEGVDSLYAWRQLIGGAGAGPILTGMELVGAGVQVRPLGHSLDPDFRDFVNADNQILSRLRRCQGDDASEARTCHLVAGQMEGDGRPEYVLFETAASGLQVTIYVRNEEGMAYEALGFRGVWQAFEELDLTQEELIARLDAGEVAFVPLPFAFPAINGRPLPVMPSDEWRRRQDLDAGSPSP